MIELDHLQIELSGMNQIEASAGTGKTYAIALLYLRILVELNLEPKQILVVTFTEAATKELRGRIRRRIREALDVIDGLGTKDPLLRALCDNANGKWGDRSGVRAALDRALKAFDTAAIFTIHGFCLRALQENAFESGSRYDTELVTDPSGLMREVVEDFWRRSFFSDSTRLLDFALKSCSVDSLKKFAQEMTGNPKLKIVPDFTPGRIEALDADCLLLFGSIQREWTAKGGEIVDLLTNDKGLSRAAGHYKETLLPDLFAGLDTFLSCGNPYDLPPDFAKFTASGIAAGKKPTGAPISHPFFDLCEELQQKVQQRLLLFRGELLDFCSGQIPARKQQYNIRFFSDLLNDLYGALCGEGGDRFAVRLGETYRAALIDEFQDTDPVQYDIFRKLHDDAALPLFLIGDPKQAIYSFRGADIFAYMQAIMDVQEGNRFTLTSNWRSTPELLEAFNLMFANDRKPFIFNEIGYHPVKPGREQDEKLADRAGIDSPMQIWLMPPEDLNVTRANGMIPRAVAAEISRLLNAGTTGRALIGDRPVVPADIAVIVRSHRQAACIRDALTPLGIPCVMRSDMTIFATDEAGEVCTLLQGLLNPGREANVRAALTTDILGRSGSDIAALLDDEQAWELCLEQFREYHQTWHDKGFMVMTRLLMEQEKVRGRLLSHSEGERRLTNLLHCFEVIHGRAHELGTGMEELATWFCERVSAKEKTEEHEIRLETDEAAVKILTVHVSKGLEYPVVFCPYMWTGLFAVDEVATCHEGTAMVKDYGSDDFGRHAELAEKEQLAESLRLLYVAVTRARYRCYLYGGKVMGGGGKTRPQTSPMAYLFHASPATRMAESLVAALAEEFPRLPAETVEEQMRQLADKSGGCIHAGLLDDSAPVPWQPDRDDSVRYACRTFSGTVRNDWRVASFTSFARHEPRAEELPDRDEPLHAADAPPQAGELPAGRNIFTFPRGARAGIFMHAIFEELDFPAASAEVITKAVVRNLELHGFDRGWQDCISEMVAMVISAPLPAPDGSFRLGELKQGSWLAELEFFFPLKFVDSDRLRRSLRGYGEGDQAVDLQAVLASLQFRPVRGMVRGFMDMVFEHGGRYYLVDWKSNHLGGRVEDYGAEAMGREMARNLYPLQYLLYTVALNRYLSLRVAGYHYERDFGGVFYFFLRGVNPQAGGDYGIFRDKPPSGLVQALTELLIETEGGAA